MDARTDRAALEILPIVEAAYAIDSSLQAWMRRLLSVADANVGWGLGGIAFAFSIGSSGVLEIDQDSSAVLGQSTEAIKDTLDGLPHAPWDWLSDCLQVRGEVARCLMTSEVDRGQRPLSPPPVVEGAVNDEVNVVCIDRDRRGALLSLGIPATVTVTSAMRTNLARVATHILAALRLRKRLARHEHDRKPYAMTEENAGRSGGLPELTPTERRVVTCAARGLTTKEVAYTLGLSDVTVRVLLMRAARRWGVSSRAELLVLGRQALAAEDG